jgi:hypothetical protein
MSVWEWDTDKGLLKVDAVHQCLFGCPLQIEPRPAPLYQERIHPDDLANGVDTARAASQWRGPPSGAARDPAWRRGRVGALPGTREA